VRADYWTDDQIRSTSKRYGRGLSTGGRAA
jgi:hypothetical protein